QGTSINWAIPASFVSMATGDATPFGSSGADVHSQQETVIRLFNTETDVAPAHPLTTPLRYSFSLHFSLHTKLLMDYGSRVSYFTTGNDNEGYWRFGKGPIPVDSEAFPAAQEWLKNEPIEPRKSTPEEKAAADSLIHEQ